MVVYGRFMKILLCLIVFSEISMMCDMSSSSDDSVVPSPKSVTPPSSPTSPVSSPLKRTKYGRQFAAEELSSGGETGSDGGRIGDNAGILEAIFDKGGNRSPQNEEIVLSGDEMEVPDESEGRGHDYECVNSQEQDFPSSSTGSSDDSEASQSQSSEASNCGDILSSSESDDTRYDSDASNDSSDKDFNAGAQKLTDKGLKTTDEGELELMEQYINKKWRKSTLKGVLSFCAEFLPSNLPKTVYKLFKYVENLTPNSYNEIKHFYCSDCLCAKQSASDICGNCPSKSNNVFYELPLSNQFQHYFEHLDLALVLDRYSCDPYPGVISDITCGSSYLKAREDLKGKYDLVLMFNSDGIAPVKSSRAHLYPILATICEVPPKLRSGFMLICGLWYDVKSAPVMNTYLTPFVNSLTELYHEGIEWTHPKTQKNCKSRVAAPVMNADAICRSDMLVLQHHNGKYECQGCEQKSVRVTSGKLCKSGNSKKIRRFVFQDQPARLRDADRMDRQGQLAQRVGHPVRGVVGRATVSKIPLFDRSSSAPPEYMHCVLLGVVKLLLNLWLFFPGKWHVGKKMKDIDAFIEVAVKVTDQFSRIPRAVKDLKFWKASEFRAWLLFVSLPALHGLLPQEYFQHYMLLVSAVFTLLEDKITENDIIHAEIKLRLFVRDISVLYGEQYYVYNVHNLLHLTYCVRKWGPLWATSAFPFESFNPLMAEPRTR